MMKRNYLSEKVIEIVSSSLRGKILDLGCGNGQTGKALFDKGFSVEAFDLDKERFQHHQEIKFTSGNLDDPLPYENDSFDYVIFMEVIEHIYNPSFVVSEISRILKPGGRLVISTPNILNIGSRFRFLFEGSFDFFREPTLDYSQYFPMAIQNMHVIPWRYQELEYLLHIHQLNVGRIHTDKVKRVFYLYYPFVIFPLFLQSKIKEFRVRKKGGAGFKRMHRILLSREMLLGRHLILECEKTERSQTSVEKASEAAGLDI